MLDAAPLPSAPFFQIAAAAASQRQPPAFARELRVCRRRRCRCFRCDFALRHSAALPQRRRFLSERFFFFFFATHAARRFRARQQA